MAEASKPSGVLVYLRTSEDNDALAWLDESGVNVTQSQLEILKAECEPGTPAVPRLEQHHELVGRAVETIFEEERTVGGQLGRPSGARFRTYERLKQYASEVHGTLFDTRELSVAVLQGTWHERGASSTSGAGRPRSWRRPGRLRP